MHYLYLCLLLLATSLFSGYTQEDSFRVMSYNIRYDNPDDSLNSWKHRKDRVTDLIKFYKPDFLGIQEGLIHQVQHLNKHLTDMGRIGVGRDDGKKAGEFSAIFYNRHKFKLVPETANTIWLSETPSKPSKSWDAALPRIMTFGKFRNRNNGQELYVFNTHFDHRGTQARAESAKLIIETIKEVAGDLPVVLTGDFNVTKDDQPYKILTGSFLNDTYNASEIPSIGPEFTFSGFDVPGPEAKRIIDYIFVNDWLDVSRYAIISAFRDGRFPSDHLPVVADVWINK